MATRTPKRKAPPSPTAMRRCANDIRRYLADIICAFDHTDGAEDAAKAFCAVEILELLEVVRDATRDLSRVLFGRVAARTIEARKHHHKPRTK